MIFEETCLRGAYVIDPLIIGDERGFFARAWCQKEFGAHGLVTAFVQSNLSFNKFEGTLRGMHRQIAPAEEVKLVRCTKGRIYDVIVDLRPDSPTHRQWFGVELSAENHRMLYVPAGFAHGYQTLEDNCEVFYQVSEFYTPEYERGARYDDPSFGIQWPLAVSAVSPKDKNWPDYVPVL
ncbi:MAG: dTDP-4-dehydrorhamnose 3,5-epimerase [Candidatus Thiothrix moscowensis]|nr:dTDP-4-dehydrorhamnose 3,5-epimerase [Candidatus Thiothrix moscowensis]